MLLADSFALTLSRPKIIRKFCQLMSSAAYFEQKIGFKLQANSLDPDQIAPYEAVWSGFKLY